MMTAVRKTATVQPDGRMTFGIPELPPGTVADVIVLVEATPPEPRAMTPAERVAAWRQLRASVNLSPEAAEQWTREIRLEREAWRLPGDEADK